MLDAVFDEGQLAIDGRHDFAGGQQSAGRVSGPDAEIRERFLVAGQLFRQLQGRFAQQFGIQAEMLQGNKPSQRFSVVVPMDLAKVATWPFHSLAAPIDALNMAPPAKTVLAAASAALNLSSPKVSGAIAAVVWLAKLEAAF